VTVQPDGKIVAAGYVRLSHQNDFAVARYNPDGTLDRSFSADGRVHSDFDGKDDVARAVAIQSDGRIVVAGTATDVVDFLPDDEDFGVERLNPDGALDTSFSGNGKTSIGFGGADRANAMVLQPDGKIVVAGTKGAIGTGDIALIRLNPDGTPDTSFGN